MSKTEVESCKKINIDWLLRNNTRLLYFPSRQITWTIGENKSSIGYDLSLRDDESYLRLYYTQTNNWTGEKTNYDYTLRINKIQCRYGGCRYYFICSKCGKRISTIYLDNSIFCCRTCNDLTYRSRKENKRNLLFSTFHLEGKNEDLLSGIKKWSYKGKLTRKARNYVKRQKRIESAYPFLFRK